MFIRLIMGFLMSLWVVESYACEHLISFGIATGVHNYSITKLNMSDATCWGGEYAPLPAPLLSRKHLMCTIKPSGFGAFSLTIQSEDKKTCTIITTKNATVQQSNCNIVGVVILDTQQGSGLGDSGKDVPPGSPACNAKNKFDYGDWQVNLQ